MIGFSSEALPIESIGYAPIPMEGYKMASSPILDNKNWTLLRKHYKANGSENYLILGNFLNDSETVLIQDSFEPFICSSTSYVGYPNSSYYYIDGVSIYQDNQTAFFPNIFTPNEDGINDYFFCLQAGFSVVQAIILNRWGEVVYEISDTEVNWDGRTNGTSCNEGVYFYKISLKDQQSKEIIIKQGAVTLVK
jgi:gliding motility-associated-like protein